jgi:hypothetical protein
LSNCGVRRKFKAYSGDDQELYNAVYQLIEYESSDDDEIMPEMIRFAPEGSHRMIFINRLAFDYVSLPTHQLKRGWVEAQEEMIDKLDPDGREVAELVVASDERLAGKKTATKKSKKLKLVPGSRKLERPRMRLASGQRWWLQVTLAV